MSQFLHTLKTICLKQLADGQITDVPKVDLGVSICLDVVSIETLDLDTIKGQSQRSRKS
jgi:hypothetical protein